MEAVAAGTRIGEYILEEPIGRGAFAEVWRARHHFWKDAFAAVKIARQGEYVKYLKREGVILHKLDHPNIVRVLGVDPDHDPPYLITEYVAGGSLRDLLQREGRISPLRTLEIIAETLEALAFAHKQGVIHRDLKPENILLDDGHVKLTDFGLGLVADDMALSSVFRSSEGATAGTVIYFSPEQRRGEKLDERSDLYTVGIILFECLTGTVPAGSEMPSEVVPHLLPGFDRIYKKLYARKENRFKSAEKALRAVYSLMERLDPEGSSILRGGMGLPPFLEEVQIKKGSAEEGQGDEEPLPPHVASQWQRTVRYAGVIPRLFAHFIDFLALSFLLGLFGPPYMAVRPIGFLLAHFIYTLVFVGSFGGTPGKLIVGLRVRSEEGRPCDFFQGFARYIVAVASLGFTYLWCFFDGRRRGVHDMAAGTVVVWRE